MNPWAWVTIRAWRLGVGFIVGWNRTTFALYLGPLTIGVDISTWRP